MSRAIDLNADMGEYCDAASQAIEAAVMQYVTSCSIACDGHAGDEESMRATAKLAQVTHTSVGAHPSYPDREGFGRRRMKISASDLFQSLTQQLCALRDILMEENIPLRHVKPHGALYNDAAGDDALSAIVAAAVKDVTPDAILVGPPASALQTAADDAGLGFAAEGFVDRLYKSNGSLTPRSDPGAVIETLDARIAQSLAIAKGDAFQAADGEITLKVKTLCIHSDSPGAAETAKAVREALEAEGVNIRAFSR